MMSDSRINLPDNENDEHSRVGPPNIIVRASRKLSEHLDKLFSSEFQKDLESESLPVQRALFELCKLMMALESHHGKTPATANMAQYSRLAHLTATASNDNVVLGELRELQRRATVLHEPGAHKLHEDRLERLWRAKRLCDLKNVVRLAGLRGEARYDGQVSTFEKVVQTELVSALPDRMSCTRVATEFMYDSITECLLPFEKDPGNKVDLNALNLMRAEWRAILSALKGTAELDDWMNLGMTIGSRQERH